MSFMEDHVGKRISVCIASYNGEKYILRQLRSILCQLSDEDEVIISDDNSSDSTFSIVNSIGDHRIKISHNTGNSGPVGNFEQAFKMASGDYIYVADQDDIWDQDKIETTKNLLLSYDLILTDCTVVDTIGTILSQSFFEKRGSRPGFWYNFYKNSYMGCCMAFRREVLEYALPFPKKIHMHDWWIGLLVEAKGKVFFYNKSTIQYVRHGNNASPTGERGYNVVKRFVNRLFILYYIAKRLWL